MIEFNGTEQQAIQIQMGINMQVAPNGNILVTATIGIVSSTIEIPANLYDEFNTEKYLPLKRNRIQLLDSIRRSKK